MKTMGAPIVPRQCVICIHFDGMKLVEDEPGLESDCILICKAFPNGIPDEIADDIFDHQKPFPNDNGIRFEKIVKSNS